MEYLELEEDFNFLIKDSDDVAQMLCLAIGLGKAGCNNCPVKHFNCDKRSDYEKQELHIPCWINLKKWLSQIDSI